MFQLKKASREQVKLKIWVSWPSGSGKTYSSLLMAYGMTQDRSKICVIDTENNSASLYSDLWDFNVIDFQPPYSPDRYIEAIKACIEWWIECIIIDSISHERNGKWGILEMKDQMTGNDFVKRWKLTKIHNKFRDAILQSNVHVISCGRSKTEYVMVEKHGKMVPEKVGMWLVQREWAEYEYTLAFDLDINHNATTSKDRTGLFIEKELYQISEQTGKDLIERTKTGKPVERKEFNIKTKFDEMKEKVEKAYKNGKTKKELNEKVSSSDKLTEEEKTDMINFIKSLKK